MRNDLEYRLTESPLQPGVTEKRKHPRFTTQIPARVKVRETGEEFQVEVQNLSKGGALVHGAVPIVVGAVVELVLDLSRADLPHEIRRNKMQDPLSSTVRWMRGTLSSFGVQFLEPL